jgi:hypothetical protein
MTKGNREMEKLVWESSVTEEMVSKLNDNEISMLVEALNDAVMEICQSYEIE